MNTLRIKLRIKISKKPSLEDVRKKMDKITCLPQPTKNKGFRGIELEKQLGISQSPDLLDCQDGEVKTRKIGQSMKITSLHHCLSEILEDKLSFEKSKVGIKMLNSIIVTCNSSSDEVSYEKHNIVKNKKMVDDYNDCCQYINACYQNKNKLSTFNGRNNFLQIRTAASKRSKSAIEKDGIEYVPLKYKDYILKDKGMAFYIKNNYFKKHT